MSDAEQASPGLGLATTLRARFPRARRRTYVPIGVVLSGVFVVVVLVLAVTGTLLAPKDPRAVDLNVGVIGPAGGFPLGTDDLGRDVLSRVIAGARSALAGSLIIAVATTAIAAVLGVVAGYRGGWLDTLIGRWVDIMYSLPSLLVAIIVVGVLGGGYAAAILVLVALNAPQDLRVVRAVALEQRALPYIEAARILGLSGARIMARHIWPNAIPVVLANFFIRFTYSLVDLSTLSFLGLGIPPGAPDWGRMLAEGRDLVFDNPLAALAPAVMIVLTAVSVNLLGDWVHDRLSTRNAAR
jgi:peptide/nickel transport system permease protein